MPSDPQTLVALETSLIERLSFDWPKRAKALAKEICAAFALNDHQGIDTAVEKVKIEISKADLAYVKFIGLSAFFFGVGRLTDGLKSKSIQNKKGPASLDNACRFVPHVINDLLQDLRNDIYLSLDAQAYLQIGVKARVQKAELLQEFVSFMEKKIETGGLTAVQLSSSLHTSRLAQFGFLVEASLMGVTTYKVNEVLDKRTCSVCKAMHGKVFQTAPAYTKMSQILSVDDPSDLKALAPWPKQDKESIEALGKLTSEELAQKGWNLPPYHPRCRGFIDYTKSQEVIMDTAFPGPQQLPELTLAQQLAMGIVPPRLVSSRPPLAFDETCSYYVDSTKGLVVESKRNMTTGVTITAFLDPITFKEVDL